MPTFEMFPRFERDGKNLTSQRQAMFRKIVLEAFVPDLGRFDRNQRFALEAIDGDSVRVEASQHDPVRQRVKSRHVVLSEKGVKFYPLEIRYAWPSELDLMGRIAGLRLRDRWANWRREPLGASTGSHISVYERSAGSP